MYGQLSMINMYMTNNQPTNLLDYYQVTDKIILVIVVWNENIEL